MANMLERVIHPIRTLQNARWKAQQALGAFRHEFGQQPPWVVARNRRKEVLDYGPAYIFIEPTNGCNLKCPMCPTGVGTAVRKRGIVSPDLVRKVVSEIKHTPIQFGFWLAGEPMIHPQIVELVRIATEGGIKPGMHSNATKITREVAEGLVKAGLEWISFSFDGDNQEDYERLRKPAKYHDTIEKIKLFLKVREELGSKTPRVTVQTIVPYQGPEIHPYGVQVKPNEEFVRQFEGSPVDYFNAILAHSWSGQLDGYEGVAPNMKDTGRRWMCIVPYRDMTISWNGDIVSCCGDLDGSNVIDNIMDKNFYEVWNGPGFQKFRRAMATDEIEKWPLCGDCERIWTVDPHPDDYRTRFEMLRFKLKI